MSLEAQQIERWRRRFESFSKAFKQFSYAVTTKGDTDDELYKAGIIQTFEFTHELSINLLKDYLLSQGDIEKTAGSRTVIRKANQFGLIEDTDWWLKMVDTRNTTVHAYDTSILEIEFIKIRDSYHVSIKKLYTRFKEIYDSGSE